MNQEHYLNYAVYMTSHGDYLVKVTDGYFASDAWMNGDEAYNDILACKFGGIFGDDGKQAHCDKCKIRRLASDEEFQKLWDSSCTLFKQNVIVLDAFEKVHKEHAKTFDITSSMKERRTIETFIDCGAIVHYCEPNEIPSEKEALGFAEWYLNPQTA